MKNTKTILMAAMAAITIGSASAETIFITGSTAFRSAANSTLYSLYGSKLMATDQATTNSSSAGNLIFTNCSVNSQLVDIVVAWGGSEQGIQSVACGTNNKTLPFYDKAKIASNYSSFPAVSATGGNMGTVTVNSNSTLAKGNICFSDTYQGASVFTGTAPDGATYTTLADLTIGVVPFTYVGNSNFPYTDISYAAVNDLISVGNTYGNVFSGVGSETNVKIWFMGRNPDSGTRVTTFAVAKAGTTTVTTQYTPTAASGSISAIAKTAAGNINGIVVTAGNNGESSGGTVCGYMTNKFATNVTVPLGLTRGAGGNYAVTYAGVSDAAGKYTSGLKYLTFNGVASRCYNSSTTTNLDQGYTNIITGKYPFWSYEHVMYDAGIATGQVTNLVSTITNTIAGYTSTSSQLAPNIALGDMLVKRTKDAGPISPK